MLDKALILIVLSALVFIVVGQLVHAKTVVSPFTGITTLVAGTDYGNGDGLPAKYAILKKPVFIKYISSSDEIYILDSVDQKIRKVSSNGKVSTIAGTGEDIGSPYSLDINSAGEMIFSTQIFQSPVLYQVKKIDKNGVLSALTFVYGEIIGVGFHPLTGDVYFCEKSSNVIRKLISFLDVETVAGGGSIDGDGEALSIVLHEPNHMIFNSAGDLYFSETGRIRKLSNGQITTIAGNGTIGYMGDGGLATIALLNQTSSLAFKPGTNDIVFADTGNSRIRLISADSGIITSIAGNGTDGLGGDGQSATDAFLSQPRGLAFTANGDLLIADSENKRIRKVSSVDGTISTYSGAATFFGDDLQANRYGILNSPQGVAISSSGEVIIADKNNGLVRKVSVNGIISRLAGSVGASFSDGILAINSGLQQPLAVTSRPNGDVYFSDMLDYRIRKISALDGKISTIVGTGTNDRFTPDGNLANETVIGSVYGIAFNSQDELIFSESVNNRIRKVLSDGTVVTLAGIGENEVSGGGYNGDGGLAINARLYLPLGLIITPSDDIIFVDQNNRRIRIIYSNGTINTIAGNGEYGYSNDGQLATESTLVTTGGIIMNSMGEVIFSEATRIRKLLTNGTLTTIAGSQTAGFSGDGELAINALLKYVTGLAIDSNDNIYICDTENNRIRKISTICPFFYALNGNECIPTCFGLNSSDSQVCSGHGQCNDIDTCNCSSPYYGSNCELFNCNGIARNSSQVCSGSGTCKSPEVCTCQLGYFGTNCESFNCSGILKSSPEVCSAHGVCQSPNNCSCQSGYYGSNCESFSCGDIDKNSLQVCSGQGVCTGPNNCTCQPQYYGSLCESFSCLGIDKNSNQVCSAHGVCQSPNNCTCQSGYYGTNCESFYCYDIPKNSSQVCSGHGTCKSLNSCSCQSGYYGTNCESFYCTGIKSTDANVCSSRGNCTALNICKCSASSFGSNCEFIVTTSPKINATNSQFVVAISQVKLNNAFKLEISTFVLMAWIVYCLFFFNN